MFSRNFLRLASLRKTRNPIGAFENFSRLSSHSDAQKFEELILKNTLISRNHLTPEISLRLITPECDLWSSKATDSQFSEDPFWGIYWPGGQAIGRFVFDNKHLFTQRNVLDIGSGSGASAIAAAKCGAGVVMANDTDQTSLIAIDINSKLNNVKVHTCQDNLIGRDIDSISFLVNSKIKPIKWDIILVGDMFYDEMFSRTLFLWLIHLVKKGKTVFVGDPGRHALETLVELKDIGCLSKIVEYDLTEGEHNGFSTAAVYKVENLD